MRNCADAHLDQNQTMNIKISCLKGGYTAIAGHMHTPCIEYGKLRWLIRIYKEKINAPGANEVIMTTLFQVCH